MRETLLIAEMQRRLFIDRELAQRARQILPQRRRPRGIERVLIERIRRDVQRRRTRAPRVAKLVVCDPQLPGQKPRLPPKPREVPVRHNKRLLREIIRPRLIGPCQMPQKTPHPRLVPPHQFAKSRAVVVADRAGDEL